MGRLFFNLYRSHVDLFYNGMPIDHVLLIRLTIKGFISSCHYLALVSFNLIRERRVNCNLTTLLVKFNFVCNILESLRLVRFVFPMDFVMKSINTYYLKIRI